MNKKTKILQKQTSIQMKEKDKKNKCKHLLFIQSLDKFSLTFLWAFGVFKLFLCLFDFICKTRTGTIFSSENSVAQMRTDSRSTAKAVQNVTNDSGDASHTAAAGWRVQMKNRYSSIAERVHDSIMETTVITKGAHTHNNTTMQHTHLKK